MKRVMVSVSVCYGGMGRLNFIPDTAALNATLYVETLLSRLISYCKPVLLSGLHSSRTVQTLTRQSWFRTFLSPTAVNLLTKISGHQTHQTLTLFSGELCLNTTRHFISSQRTLKS